MSKRSIRVSNLALAAICVSVIVVAMGAERARSPRRAILAPERQQFLFSATDIIVLSGGNLANDSDIARLDTETGAIYRLRGDVNNPSVRNTWELRVRPVKGKTSGLLEIQQVVPTKKRNEHDPTPPAPVTFLVDIVNGQTWILRERANTNFSWDLVEVYRSAQFH